MAKKSFGAIGGTSSTSPKPESKTLYTDIIEPLGSRAKERKEEFEVELAKVTNRMTKEFLDNFCLPDGTIQWKELVEFNASIIQPKKKLAVP